ncbi:hypothetical protein [Micromonospora aurantiaca (nom. illeg.)]|uniref:hypothetical protein n=1 Tax=Micromonospora aurantiaca (nom. illeg.) TaxID=47850 RepID=UPI0033E3CACF
MTTTRTRTDPTVPAVISAIAIGARRPADIRQRTGFSERGVQTALEKAASDGLITRRFFGSYDLTDAGRVNVMALATVGTADTATAPGHSNDELAQADLPTLWQHQVARYTLPGSRLVDHWQVRPGVEECLLLLDPSRHTINDALAHRRRITAGLQCPAEQVIIEPDASQIDSRARLIRVDETSPLYHELEHPGATAFDPATGNLTIGLHADGVPATWRLWSEHGATHHLVCGSGCSGATDLLRALAAVAGSDVVCAHCIDPSGVTGLTAAGQPATVRHADTVNLLKTIIGIIDQRNRQSVDQKLLIPSREHPLLLLVLAELPVLLNDLGVRHLIDRIHRTASKAGIAIVADTTSLMISDFHGNVALRDGLVTEGLTLLRGADTSFLPTPRHPGVDPTALPQSWHNGVSTAGVGYTTHRNAPFRCFRVRREPGIAQTKQ